MSIRHFITGGSGFIGSHLVDRLMADGCQVTVYDNLVSGQRQNMWNHIFKGQNFKFIPFDLLDFDALKSAMEGHDVVWHLGANTDIPRGNKEVDLDLKNCTIATHNVLEAMRQLGINKILFTSSATVYGDIAPKHCSEDYAPLLPISLYGAGKLACEGLISAYCALFGIKAWVFRFANVVGARMGHGVIHDFIEKLKQNPEELEILGDGKQKKPFFLVEDCIDAMIYAFERSKEWCGIFNIGCGTYTNVKHIAEIVVDEMGLGDVKFKYTGGRRGWVGDVPVVYYNVDKMKELGWVAKHDSDEAVRIATRRLLGKE